MHGMNPSRAELTTFAPHWCLYWANSFARSQFEIWQPLLERSAYRYLVLVDGPGSVPASLAALEADGRIMFGASTAMDKQWLHDVPTFRGFLYVSNKNRIFGNVGGFSKVRHVFIGHGESAKASSGARVASLYDSVFLAAYESGRRFPAAIHHQVRRHSLAIGAPIVHGVVPVGDGAAKRSDQDPVILFAPTWEGHSVGKDYSSLPEVGGTLSSLLSAGSARVVLRPHPGNGKRSETHREAAAALWKSGAAKPGGKAADINSSDVLIGDLSGATSEFLFSRKPVIIPYTDALRRLKVRPDQVRAQYPWAYLWDTATEDLSAVLAEALGPDPLRKRREAAADRMFRGHRTTEEATRTFDLALGAVWNFRNPVVRRVRYELARARRSRSLPVVTGRGPFQALATRRSRPSPAATGTAG